MADKGNNPGCLKWNGVWLCPIIPTQPPGPSTDPGPPGIHAPTHEDGGADELDVDDLDGVLEEDQHVIPSEAVDAMGIKGDGNALNHDRYADTEAVASMGGVENGNPLNHVRYVDSEAVDAMGIKADANPLNHDRYTDTEAEAVAIDADWIRPPIADFYDPTGGLPVAPSEGDRYISEATANGWTEDYVYEWNGTSWEEDIPEEGWTIWNLLELIYYVFFSGGWMALPSNHHLTHEDGGDDEIDVAGLSGVLADDQHIIDGEAIAAVNAKVPTVVNVANYNILADDEILLITRVSAGICSIRFLTAQIIASNRRIIIKNIAGIFSTTLTCEGGELIDGQPSVIITGAYDSITVSPDGVGLFIT